MSPFSSFSFCISNLSLRLRNDCLSVGKPPSNREDKREGHFQSPSLIDIRRDELISFLSLIDILALTLSTDSVATRFFAFWYTETAFLLIRLALLGMKVVLGGLSSLGMNPSG